MTPTLLLRSLMGLTMLFPGLPGHLARRAHIRQGGDPARLTERFGASSLPRPEGGLIWIHAASVGEVVSISSLVRLITARTDLTILMTTTTMTGAKAVASHLPGVLHQFLPIDTPKAVADFLTHWRPALACFVEGDLWPRLLFSLYQQGVPVALLNARPSKTRTRAPRSFAALLGEISLVTVQAPVLLQEFRDLGIAPNRIHAPGNLKADMPPMYVDPEKVDLLRAARSGGGVWAAVSTHPGEEEIVLDAHTALQSAPLLILAPRHPVRGNDLAELLRRRGLVFTRHSLNEMPEPRTQVHLLDALGELGAVYAVADMALIGGSLVQGPGGHTPYEAAQLDCAMLSGPHVRNFQMAYDVLVEKGAVRIVQDTPDLINKLDALLAAPSMLEEMRLAARVNQAQHAGAVERSFALLAPFLLTAGLNAGPRGDTVQL